MEWIYWISELLTPLLVDKHATYMYLSVTSNCVLLALPAECRKQFAGATKVIDRKSLQLTSYARHCLSAFVRKSITTVLPSFQLFMSSKIQIFRRSKFFPLFIFYFFLLVATWLFFKHFVDKTNRKHFTDI
jgi:hypothetical protein